MLPWGSKEGEEIVGREYLHEVWPGLATVFSPLLGTRLQPASQNRILTINTIG